MAAQVQMAQRNDGAALTKYRLTSIETLPEAVITDAQWLFDAITAERMSQTEMLEQFNQRMATAGQAKASMSGLNRYVIKVRNGSVRRPQAIATVSAGSPSAILQDQFRAALVKKQGLHATLALEAALSALLQAEV